jgi:hypothetical protein
MKKLFILLLLCTILCGLEMQAQQYRNRRYVTRTSSQNSSQLRSRSVDCRRCCAQGRFADPECQKNCNCHIYGKDDAHAEGRDFPR